MTEVEADDLPYRPCVGVMLINDAGLIFAGLRNDRNPDDPPAWQMPQGGIDKDEKPRKAALRELWEETGVTSDLVEFLDKSPEWLTYDLPPELLGKVWGGKYRGQKQRWYLYRFTGQDDQIDIAMEHPEFSEWKWVSAEEMLSAIVPFKRTVYAAVIDAFRQHLA